MPPQRESFRQTASAAPEPIAPGSAPVSSIAIARPATRSRTARSAAIPWTGSSTSSSPAACSASIERDRLVDRPRAVGVEPDRHRRAGRRAHGGDAPGVVADADLDLHAREALGRGARWRPRPRRAVVGADRRVDRRRAASGSSASSAATGRPSRRDRAVPQREVDRGQRLRQVGGGAAGVEHVGAAAAVAQRAIARA